MVTDSRKRGMTRRAFAKATAATVAMAAVSSSLFGCGQETLEEGGEESIASFEEAYGVCRMCQQQYCSYKAIKKDGVVIRLEGVPESLLSNGTLCARGNSNIAQHYNPYRVKTPLQRTNTAKGMDVDPGWKEITWDEALQIVADRLIAIREDDPRKFAYNQGFSRTGILIGDTAYVAAFGSPNAFRSNGPLCATHFAPASTVGTFLGPNYDFAYTDYCLCLGRNMGASTGVSSGGSRGDGGISAKNFLYSMDRGMKLVCVSPRLQPEALHENAQWLPLTPGSEFSFVMALLNILLHELDTYDKEFVTWRTNLPYLILPEGGYIRDENNKPLIWDAASGSAKAFDDESLEEPALEGSYDVNGVTVQPAFVLLKESVKDTTPEKAAPLAGITADEIRAIANDLVKYARIGETITIEGVEMPLRPVAVIAGRGVVSKKDGILCHMAAININMLLGAVGVPGGVHPDCWGAFFAPDEDGLVGLVSEAVPWWATKGEFSYPPNMLDLKEFYPVSHHMPHLAYKVIADPEKYGMDYTLDTLLSYGGNAVQHNAAPDNTLAAMAKIPFIVSISYHMDEPTWMSDIVLPEDSNFERYIAGRCYKDVGLKDGQVVAFKQTNIQRPVVDRLYDTRQPDDIFVEIAERVGFLHGEKGVNASLNKSYKDDFKIDTEKKYTIKELLDSQVKSDWGAEHGMDEEGPFIQEIVPMCDRYAYSYHPGKATRHRVYFDHLLETGRKLKAYLQENGLETVPGWEGKEFFEYYVPLPKLIGQEAHVAPEGYPLQVINWKTPQFIGLIGGNDNPYLYQVSKDFDPYMFGACLNTKTAVELGIQAGDAIVVESPYGKVQTTAIITETIHPGCVGIAGNLGRMSPGLNPIALDGPVYNHLLPDVEGMIDPIAGQISVATWVRVEKA